MNEQKSKLIPKAIALSIVLVVATLVWEKYSVGPLKFNLDHTEDIGESKNLINGSTERAPASINPTVKAPVNKEIAYVEAVSFDEKTHSPVYKMHIPKGKRLYDEEKMKEIAADGNMDPDAQEETKL
jgi:hypothetical protein